MDDLMQAPVAYQDTAKHTELVAAEDWENIDPMWHWMYRPLYTADQMREYAKQGVEAERARLLSYDKTDMNGFVSDLYDEKTREGKHGHYETVFHVVHCAIKRVASD